MMNRFETKQAAYNAADELRIEYAEEFYEWSRNRTDFGAMGYPEIELDFRISGHGDFFRIYCEKCGNWKSERFFFPKGDKAPFRGEIDGIDIRQNV